MKINDYILKEIKVFHLQNTVKEAQKTFKNNPITHFPVIDNDILLGNFAEEDIQIIDNKEEKLIAHSHLLNSFFADEKATVLELLKIFADNDTNIIPVINKEKKYIGYYDLRDVLDVFSTNPFMIEESETLIIKHHKNDYSMSEVAQIVESNGGKLLGVYISERNGENIQLILKIVTQEMNEIMHSFRRYDYKIVSTHENDIYLEDLKNRSDYLQKYLEM